MNRIKEVLETSPLKRCEIAESLGVHESLITDWTNGKALPSFDNLLKLADFFAVSVDYLLNRSDDMTECHTKNIIPFNENLLKILERKTISKYKLFKDCGLSKSTKVAWFTNGSKPSVANVIKLADYFNLPVDDIMGRVI